MAATRLDGAVEGTSVTPKPSLQPSLPSGSQPSLPLSLQHEMSAQQLLRRSRRLLWLTLLPLLGLVLLLAAWQAVLQWGQVLEAAAGETRTQRFAFEVIARDADSHVADLRYWMRQEFVRTDGKTAAPAVLAAWQPRLTAAGRADGFSLDSLPQFLRSGMAQMLWPQSVDAAKGGDQRPALAALHQAQTLAAVIEVAHQRNSDLVASYYYGAPDPHLVLFPWTSSSSLAQGQGAADMSRAVLDRYQSDVVRAGTPAQNPLQQPYWTTPRHDGSGPGWVVSRAMPLFVADEWRGVVGTDIKLVTLEQLLHSLPGAPWAAWVVDDRGHILADRQRPLSGAVAKVVTKAGAKAGDKEPTAGPSSPASGPPAWVPLAAHLPAGIDLPLLARASAQTNPVLAAHGQRLIAVRIAGAPWILVLAAPEAALLRTLLPQVLPYSLIALGLLAVWLLGQAVLRQRLLTPVLQVLGYLHRLSVDATAPEPRLSPRWQPWVQVVTRTFDSLRQSAQGQLRADTLKSAIVDHAQTAVVVAGADGCIVEFNPAAEAMLRCPRDQALGQTVRELLSPERYRASFDMAVARMRSGDPDHLMGRRLERICCRADGSELPVEVVMWMTQVEGAAYFTASMTDLTQTKASAEVIERQRDALRQSEKLGAMGSLLAGVAHELNNPLAIVMGRASLLEEETEGSVLHSDAVRIREAAERCGRIVRTFLNMARSRPAQHGPVRLNDLVRAAADMLGYTLRSHGIEIELRLADKLPEVQADGDQIGQVVLNLIVNAQQALATHPAPRSIRLQSGHRPATAGTAAAVWLRVSDSGAGVAAALRDKVFEPFFTTKAEGMGTGIGLSVSRAIVREHGGDLVLEGNGLGAGLGTVAHPDGLADRPTDRPTDRLLGAQFFLSLPLITAPPPAGVADAPSVAAAAPNARVLVVDDEEQIADLLRAMLEAAGYEVATADSGALALEMLNTARFDAIVSDLRMPDMDGAALWRAVRDQHPALARRMVFVTGDTLSPGARQFLDDTGCRRLDKPFARADLLAQVGWVLQQEAMDV